MGTTRLECRAWAGLAEHINESLTCGDRVVITGRLRQRPINGGGHVFDVVLDDVGVSLVFCNVWLLKADPRTSGAQDTSHNNEAVSAAPE